MSLVGWDGKSTHSFLRALQRGSYRLPHSNFIERVAKEQGFTEDISWLLEFAKHGGRDFAHSVQAKLIVEGLIANHSHWRENMYEASILRHGIKDSFPNHLIEYSTQRNREVCNSNLLFITSLFSTQENPAPVEFWAELIETRYALPKWSDFLASNMLSSHNIIGGFDRVAWDVELWQPDEEQMKRMGRYIDGGIDPTDAFAWNLANWEVENKESLTVQELHNLKDNDIDQFTYLFYAREEGISTASLIIGIVREGMDLGIAQSLNS